MAIQDHLGTPLAKAVRFLGGQSAMAELIGKHQSTIHDWLKEDRPLPAEFVFVVESETGISRHELRPDIYPVEEPPMPGTPPGGAPAEPTQRSAGVPESLKGLQS